MIVCKFGGTALADAERYRHAARVVGASGEGTVVVVSAPAGVTNDLIAVAAAAVSGDRAQADTRIRAVLERCRVIAADLTPDSRSEEGPANRVNESVSRLADSIERAGSQPGSHFSDEVCAVGEDVSVLLMATALSEAGVEAKPVDARDVIRTDDRFGAAVPLAEETTTRVREVLLPHLERGCTPVLQGFVGATPTGATTTLGRGGSDFTAAIVGAALGADEVWIWTDVDGVMSADPADVRGARTIAELGYEEAVELAYFGAKAIHPAAAKHAAACDVSLRVRNAFRPEAPGTLIRPDRRRAAGVAAVASKPGIVLIKVRSRPMFMAYGFLARVFDVLARHRSPVDLVATSHTSTAFTIDEHEGLVDVREQLSRFAEVEVVRGLATVSVIGHGLLGQLGIAARVFSVLGNSHVELISQASDVSLSLLVAADEAPDIVRWLHAELIE